jgi:hypothetical protein
MRAEALQHSCRMLLCAFLILGLSQCGWDEYQHATIDGDSRRHAHVLYDSPAVQRMVDQALAAKQEYSRDLSTSDSSKRLATLLGDRAGKAYQKLLKDMPTQPGYDVPRQTKFKILFESDISPYSKVEFESGLFKGQIGWISRGSFDDPRTHMP